MKTMRTFIEWLQYYNQPKEQFIQKSGRINRIGNKPKEIKIIIDNIERIK